MSNEYFNFDFITGNNLNEYKHENRKDIEPLLRSFNKEFEFKNEYQPKNNGTSYFKTNSALDIENSITTNLDKIESELKQSEQRRDYYLETPLTEFRKLYHSQRSPVSEKSIENKASSELGSPEKTSTPRSKNSRDRSPKSKKDELEILKDNISKIYNIQDNEVEEKIAPIDTEVSIEENEGPKDEINTLSGQVILNKTAVDDIQDSNKAELVLIVESTVETTDVSETDMRQEIPTQMTIIVSPRITAEDGDKALISDSISPEKAARLTRNDALDAIFHADSSKVHSSVEIDLNTSKEATETDENQKSGQEYADDFSADVDNYNSRSGSNSPISVLKNSDDDNFWDTN
jgi:hypothetical protein